MKHPYLLPGLLTLGILILTTDLLTGQFFPSPLCQPAPCALAEQIRTYQHATGALLPETSLDIAYEQAGFLREELSRDGNQPTVRKFFEKLDPNIRNLAVTHRAGLTSSSLDKDLFRDRISLAYIKAYGAFLSERNSELTSSLEKQAQQAFPQDGDVYAMLTFVDGLKSRYAQGNTPFSLENITTMDSVQGSRFDVVPVSLRMQTTTGTLLKFLSDMQTSGVFTPQNQESAVLPLVSIGSLKIIQNTDTTRTDDVTADMMLRFYLQPVSQNMISDLRMEITELERTLASLSIQRSSDEQPQVPLLIKRAQELQSAFITQPPESLRMQERDLRTIRDLLKEAQTLLEE